ncbi:MAG: FAD:protein FMN transferase [Gammaproteobacteria bacterium]|nr:FAD:protein FMN transferase [Gammaproteobacteria bacterium]
MRRRSAACALLTCLLLALTGCGRHSPEVYKTQLMTLGTIVDISLWNIDEPKAQQAVKAVEDVLNEIHVHWHAWEPGMLTDLNTRLAAGETVTVSPEDAAVLLRTQELARAGEQLFNPAIGRLIGLWGFHSDDPPQGPPPAVERIQELVDAHPSMEDLVIEGTAVHSRNPLVQLDLGGSAKGYAVDKAIDALRALGIGNAIVNAGGGLHAIGAHGDRPWRVGIRNPAQPGIIASLEMGDNESVHTSGNYERFFDYQGKRYHHILDPRTGYPAEGVLSVTVVHPDGTLADAADDALFIAGPSGWKEVARRMGVTQVMLIDADMTVHITPQLADRLRMETDPPPKMVVEPLQ